MRGFLLLVCWATTLASQEDATAEQHAFVEVEAPQNSYFVHQPIRLRLRFGVEAQFLRARMIQLFRQRLDMPVRIEARWFDELAHTIRLPEENEPGERRLSFVLNNGAATATPAPDRVQGSRRFRVAEIARSYLPERAGELVVPAPRMHLAYATRFRRDFLRGPVAEDRRDSTVQGQPLVLRILPLPEAGRPREFAGAVGRFQVTAEAAPHELRVGETLRLVLEIVGDGNLAHFDPPRLDGLQQFHVFGQIESRSGNRRRITYDVTPLSASVVEVPPIRFAFFDPAPAAGYRTVTTQPIPLRVRPNARFAPPVRAARSGATRRDIYGIRPVGPRSRAAHELSGVLLVLVLIAPWLLALGFLTWRRARAAGRVPTRSMRCRMAAARFRSRAGESGADPGRTFAVFLAACLDCPVAAVIAPELPARLVRAGVPGELAERAAALLETLVARRYGGPADVYAMQAASDVVDMLETAWSGDAAR